MPTVSRGFPRWLSQKTVMLEDFADRLSHVWTTTILLVMACIIAINHEHGEPIRCWCPAHFVDSMVRYTAQHCWNMNFLSHRLSMMNIDKRDFVMPYINNQRPDKSENEIVITVLVYYRWLPLILCFQSLLFKLPNIFFYVCHGLSGINFDKVSNLTLGYANMNVQQRRLMGWRIACYMTRWCKVFESCGGLPWRALTLLWLVVKILYCVNASLQFSAVNRFLSTFNPPLDNSSSYGDVIYDNIFQNNASLYRESPVFPKVVLCDFRIRQFRNVQRYRVQCDLKANYFNESAYMFIWVWLAFVTIATGLSLAIWILRIILPSMRKRYIVRALDSAEDVHHQDFPPSDINSFCNMIGEDGVMVLKLLSDNSSELLVSDVLASMWKQRFSGRPKLESDFIPEMTPSMSTNVHMYPDLEAMKGQ